MSDEIVKVHCPECNKSYKVKKAVLGKKTTCRQCSTKFELKLRKKSKPKQEEVKDPPPPLETPAEPPEDPQEEGDPNGLKFCPTCELQTEHEENVCSICNNLNTGEKPLVEKIKTHPFLSKEFKTPVGLVKMQHLLGGIFILLFIGVAYTLFMGEEEKPKRKPRPPKPVATKTVAKPNSQAKVVEEKEPELEKPPEPLPAVSIYMKQGLNIRPVFVKQFGSLLIGISTAKELMILENNDQEMNFIKAHLLGSFKKFRIALYQKSSSSDKAIQLSTTVFDDLMEEKIYFHDFEQAVEGSIKKEEEQWVFTKNDGKRPRKFLGVLMNQNKELIGFVSGVKGTSLLCYPLNASVLTNAGQWTSEKPLSEVIEP